MDLKNQLEKVKKDIPSNVTLVAVSKTQAAGNILQVYQFGHKIFGENKVQELTQKASILPADIQWHFIGHLQSNKVRNLLPYVTLIHSVDSFKLLQVINYESLKINKITDCLLQFFIASETTKYGLDLSEAHAILISEIYKELKNVRIRGVMGMATFTDNTEQIRREFKELTSIFTKIKQGYFIDKEYFNEISMGMSDDYNIAIEEGSTIVRIGTAIFGSRIVP
ncbi:MAG: YggS family pyridoxal phosphate-dependent enzyme [Bacteroidales bacterium]